MAGASDGGGASGTGGAKDGGGDAAEGWDSGEGGQLCSSTPAPEALGPRQVVASDRVGLAGIGTSSEGPLWLEQPSDLQVVLGTASLPVLWRTSAISFQRETFTARGGWFALDYQEYPAIGYTGAVIAAVSQGTPQDCPNAPAPVGGPFEMEISGSFLYDLSPGTVTRLRLDGSPPCSHATVVFPRDTPPPAGASAVAVDDRYVYIFVAEGSDTYLTYTIAAAPKAGGATTTVVHGVDTESPSPGQGIGLPTLRAQQGSLAWAWALADGGTTAHSLAVLPRAAAAERVVGEPEGIAVNEDEPVLALDDHYVYWATLTGDVKREPICGGTAEILAQNQDEPIDIAVDDNGVYWLDHGTQPGTGKVMEMKKLGAPQPEAGADASLDSGENDGGIPDASSESVSSDASLETGE
jgi:hypothetical protein